MDGGMYLVNSGLQKDDQDRTRKGWEMVERNVERIRSTVLDILYYAKDREPDYQEVAVTDVIEEVCGVLQAKADNHNIVFAAKIEADIKTIEADRQALRSMLVNMIDNAFDACRMDKWKDEHVVSLAVDGNADEVRFTIEDNGIGMSQDVQDKAFTLFFSSKGSGGTGLGLFIAHKIVQAHGGRIDLDSEQGRGTRFDITIPRVHVEQAPTEAPDVTVEPTIDQEAAWGEALGESED